MKLRWVWVARMRIWWAATFTLLLLLNLDQFGVASGLGPAPKHWSVGVFVVTTVLCLPGLKPAVLLRQPLIWWTLGYVLLSLLWIGVSDTLQAAGEGLVLVVTTCLYVSSAVLIYPQLQHSDRTWSGVLWAALLVAVGSILLEYFNPAAYMFAEAGQGIVGRAAGLYLNPNIAAQTLVMLLACVMIRNPPIANLVAAVVALLGLFLTFSRAGLLAWAILVAAATTQGRLPRWFVAVIGLGIVMTLLAGPMVLDALTVWITPENRNVLDRLAWLLGQGSLSDYSAGEREYIAAYAWQQFMEAPLLGHGLGSMWVWGAGVGTHNLFLRHLVEYGLLGVLIYPAFLYCALRAAPRDGNHRWRWTVGGLALLLSLFTHNLLEQATFLLPWLALCLISVAKGGQAGRRKMHERKD